MRERAKAALTGISGTAAVISLAAWALADRADRQGRVDEFHNTLAGVMQREVTSGGNWRMVAVALAVVAVLALAGAWIASASRPPER